jgi:hypothetical protein
MQLYRRISCRSTSFNGSTTKDGQCVETATQQATESWRHGATDRFAIFYRRVLARVLRLHLVYETAELAPIFYPEQW